ncbi:S1 family peptidase [Dawidia soli]|uniref:S1C family serine protease n=1 Tax=Dawidia soli TaxID=2782352 RepID=A0AAP2GE84_9BACT|nr:serine protease [Dawidia soli]MBT1688114.1 S1C family serine protease [Dawidia soli]
MNNCKILIAFALFVLLARHATAQLSAAQINQLGASVVKITIPLPNGKEKIATGFIYQSKEYAVTAYHVVAGASNILVRYERQGAERTATVQKIYKHADLALIKIDNPLNVAALQLATAELTLNQNLTALGFYFDAKSMDQRKLSLSSSNELRNILPSKNVTEIKNNGCPGLSLVIHKLQDNPLLPGFSGCPVLNSQGRVVGIGDGGLENGAYSISWAIPVSEIAKLMASTESFGTTSLQSTLYFSADITNEGETVNLQLADLKFLKLRTRSLAELAASSETDDLQGLNQMINTFPVAIDRSRVLFDIYQEASSGAALVLPKDMTISISNTKITVTDATNTYETTIEVATNLNQDQMQQKSAEFEGNAAGFSLSWLADPQFTYFCPAYRADGLIVRRKAFVGWAGQQNPQEYMMETFAFKNGVLLCAANKKKNYNIMFLNQRNICVGSNFQSAGCSSVLQDMTTWGAMTVAIHLTSFSI